MSSGVGHRRPGSGTSSQPQASTAPARGAAPFQFSGRGWWLLLAAPFFLFGGAIFYTSPHRSRVSSHSSGGGVLDAALSATRHILDPDSERCGLDTPGWWRHNVSFLNEERFVPEAARWKWHIEAEPPCSYSVGDFNDFVEAFRGKTLTFVGDSTMRTLFFDFTCSLLRCFDGSDNLGPRGGDGEEWDLKRVLQCQYCDGGRYIPSAVLELGSRYGDITLRWYWLSWMDYLQSAPVPESIAWAEDWRSYVDTIPREFDFQDVFNDAPGDFFALGLGLWELKYPGWPVNATEAVAPEVALAYFEGSLKRLVEALLPTRVGGQMAAEGRFVFRGLPIMERLGEPNVRAMVASGLDPGALPYRHYNWELAAAAQAVQAAVLDGTSLPYFDVAPLTHYPLSSAKNGGVPEPGDEAGYVLSTDSVHPRPFVSLAQMRAILSFFADSVGL